MFEDDRKREVLRFRVFVHITAYYNIWLPVNSVARPVEADTV